MTQKTSFISLATALLSLLSCSAEPVETPVRRPAMQMEIIAVKPTAVTLQVDLVNADHGSLLVRNASAYAPAPEEVAASGTSVKAGEVTLDALESGTDYILYGVAVAASGAVGQLEQQPFTTEASSGLYPWEDARAEVPSFSNLDLLYGGSAHRVPNQWSPDRLAPHVSYIDPSGQEQWLFDAFLAIEFVDTKRKMAISLGYNTDNGSATRISWEALLDYWFEQDAGFDALEKAVAAVAGRIGQPPYKRRVVMTIPDPIPLQFWSDPNSTSVYWGRLDDGTTVDMLKPEHRLAVMRWFVNQFRERWHKKEYQHLELAGFYIVNEELATPGDGWGYQFKMTEDIYPAFCDYLHKIREGMFWIPYFEAPGWRKWKSFGIDYAYMQPNYFWGKKDKATFARFFSDILPNGMGMEIELDEDVVVANAGTTAAKPYRERLYEYMNNCKTYDIYGNRRLAYYLGQDALYQLARSTRPEDMTLYQDFCAFVAGNTYR